MALREISIKLGIVVCSEVVRSQLCVELLCFRIPAYFFCIRSGVGGCVCVSAGCLVPPSISLFWGTDVSLSVAPSLSVADYQPVTRSQFVFPFSGRLLVLTSLESIDLGLAILYWIAGDC